ncbi:MAG: hypothetical protein ABF532_09105 [Bifidobacterium sp.]|uniref:hypothetical protein n=1 Tax=Bifidobacterium sp. TaxID=41200 RepID=UPI0039E9C563
MASQFDYQELVRLALFQDRINGAGYRYKYDPEPVSAYAVQGANLYTIYRVGSADPESLESWRSLTFSHTMPPPSTTQRPAPVHLGDIVVERTTVEFDERGDYTGFRSDVAVSTNGPHSKDPESIQQAGQELVRSGFAANPEQFETVTQHGAIRLETADGAHLPYGWAEAQDRMLERMMSERPEEARLSLLQQDININTPQGAVAWFLEPNGRDLHKVVWEMNDRHDRFDGSVLQHMRVETADGSDPYLRAGTPYVKEIASSGYEPIDDPWSLSDDTAILRFSRQFVQDQMRLDGGGTLPEDMRCGVAWPSDAPAVLYTTGEHSHPALDLNEGANMQHAMVETMEQDIAAERQQTRGPIKPHTPQTTQDAKTRFRAQIEQRTKQKLATQGKPKMPIHKPTHTR